MHFWKDYLSQVFSTFWHALALTDTLVIGAFIVAGILAALGFFGGHAEHPAWWIALAIFLVLRQSCAHRRRRLQISDRCLPPMVICLSSILDEG
jgi:hypothetical protein